MRRTASQVIRSLEARVARLERQASMTKVISTPTTTTQLFRVIDGLDHASRSGITTLFKKIFKGLKKDGLSPKEVVIDSLGVSPEKKVLLFSLPNRGLSHKIKITVTHSGNTLSYGRRNYPVGRGGAQGFVSGILSILSDTSAPTTSISESTPVPSTDMSDDDPIPANLSGNDLIIAKLKKGYKEAGKELVKVFGLREGFPIMDYFRLEENKKVDVFGFDKVVPLQVIFEYDNFLRFLKNWSNQVGNPLVRENEYQEALISALEKCVTRYVPKEQYFGDFIEPQNNGLSGKTYFQDNLDRLSKSRTSSSRTAAPDPRFAANALASNVMSSRSAQVKNALKNGMRLTLASYNEMVESQSPTQVIRSQKFYDIATNNLSKATRLQAEIDKEIAYRTKPRWMSERELEAGFSDSVITMASQQLVQTYSAYITGKSDIDAL